jgi:hypothetical protein
MDSGLSVRRTSGGAPSAARATATPSKSVATTELSLAQTVTAAGGVERPDNDTAHSPVPDTSRMGGVVLDPHSREVIYRAADIRSRRVKRQMPEIAARRLQAYTQSAKPRIDPDDRTHADIEV